MEPHLITPLAICITTFFVGAIPTGYVVGRLYGIDIRKHGSGNIGATNAGRLLGKKAGVITLIGDAGKGIFAALLPRIITPDSAELLSPLSLSLALIGHCYSPFLSFRGGKGVATGFGGFLVITPLPVIIACVVFAIVSRVSNYVSAGSISAALTFAFVVILDLAQFANLSIKAAAVICTLIILLRHRENLNRLAHHEELRSTDVKQTVDKKLPP